MKLDGQKIVLIGMGKTSLALARLIVSKGGNPFVTELRSKEECTAQCASLDEMSIKYECGGHSDTVLANADWLVPSPGVSFEHALCVAARDAGIPVVSELEMASGFIASKVIAVTGTNGKTTTTELIAHLLRTAGKQVELAGNNNTPCSEIVLCETQPEFLVLEVSSYQLEGANTFHPDVAVVLNLTNDHLGRHKTMEQYAATKAKLLVCQTESDLAVLNHDDPYVFGMAVGRSVPVVTFGKGSESSVTVSDSWIQYRDKKIAKRSDCPLPGAHNTDNIMASITAILPFDISIEEVQEGLRSFKGVEHRIEPVRELDGIRFYNDSKATNLDSLKVALESFDQPVVLIAGGEGKGSDYGSINGLIGARVKHVVAIGTDAELIEQAWGAVTSVSCADSMNDAVGAAFSHAKKGEIVLLSPACASFDMYTNFEERGRDFKRCVNALVSSDSLHGASS